MLFITAHRSGEGCPTSRSGDGDCEDDERSGDGDCGDGHCSGDGDCGDGDCEDDERLELDDILPACKSVDLAHQIAWQSVP